MNKIAALDDTGITVLKTAFDRIRRNSVAFNGQFPSYGDGDAAYRLTPNQNWLAAFWSGLLWLVAHESKASDDIARARALIPSFVARLDEGVRLNHDLGFLYLLSARANWQICDDKQAHALAIRAADVLLGRFRTVGGFIQAWGEADDKEERGRFIIDCMMNLPLLYWASRETGDPRYTEAATRHADTSHRYLMRDDGSSYHTFYLDATDGMPIGPKTHQGYADDSVWSRGQAWAIYGFTMAAEWSGEASFLQVAEDAAEWYLNAIQPDVLAPWDFSLPDNADTVPDSSADAIAAGGLLRLAKATGNDRYFDAAVERILLLIDAAFDTRPHAQGFFLHGTQHMPHNYGVDTYTIFGDYFALEAIMTTRDQAPDFWGPNSK